MTEAKERIEWIDLASGIMILWLMLFHALEPSLGANITGAIPFLYFFMPWFFFKSGMLFKVKDIKVEFITNFKKLIIDGFLVWSVIGYVAYILDHWLIFKDITLRLAFYTPVRSLLLGGAIPLNGALWFLPVLFLVRQVFNYTRNKYTFPIWLTFSIGFIISAVCYLTNTLYIPSYIHSFGWGLCCFTAGYWFANIPINKKWIIVVSALIYIATLFTTIPDNYCVRQGIIVSALWIPASIFSCIFFNYLCQSLCSPKNPLKKALSALKFIGKNSMIFYVSHYIIFRIVFDIIGTKKIEWYSTWFGLMICMICYFVAILLILLVQQKHQKYS